MPLAILKPLPPSRVVRPRELPRAAPAVALRAVQQRHHITPPPAVVVPPRPTRARRVTPLAPVERPAPLLRLLAPPAPAPVRLVLRAPAPAPPTPTPLATVQMAIAVGIQGGGGTRVINVPADLTQPGLVNITQFRVALTAGSW